MIPKAIIDILSKAPPENMLNMLKMVFSLRENNSARLTGLIPGTGICEPKR